MRFEIYPSPANGLLQTIAPQWRWRLRGSNGEIIASGESYARRADCEHAINLVKSTGPATPVVEMPH